MVRIVLAIRNTAKAMPMANPPLYQIREERATHRASRLASSMFSSLIRKILRATVLICRNAS